MLAANKSRVGIVGVAIAALFFFLTRDPPSPSISLRQQLICSLLPHAVGEGFAVNENIYQAQAIYVS